MSALIKSVVHVTAGTTVQAVRLSKQTKNAHLLTNQIGEFNHAVMH